MELMLDVVLSVETGELSSPALPTVAFALLLTYHYVQEAPCQLQAVNTVATTGKLYLE